MNEDELTGLFRQVREILSNHVAGLMQAGAPDHVCLAALGSIAGHLIGLNHSEEDHAGVIDTMKEPMLASAKKARKLKDSIIAKHGN